MLRIAVEGQVEVFVIPEDLGAGLLLLPGFVPRKDERPDRGARGPVRLVETAVDRDRPAGALDHVYGGFVTHGLRFRRVALA